MRTKGGGKLAYIRYWPRTLAIDVLLSFNFAVVFNFNVFPFTVPMNRQNAANCSPCYRYYMFFCVMEGDGDREGDGDGDSQRWAK
jgi:hypothetical protein